MFCSKCGKEIKSGGKFCSNCGTKIEATGYVNQTVNGYNNQPIPIPVKKSSGTIVAIVVIAIIVFVFGAGSYSLLNVLETQREFDNATEEFIDGILDIFGDNASNSSSTEKYADSSNGNSIANSTEQPADSSAAPAPEDDPFAGYKDLEYTSYAFANMAKTGDAMYITPNGTVNDSTVLYNGKTVGDFADYVDNKVLEKGRKLDRKFFYDMISVNVIDPSLSSDPKTFQSSMIYLLTVTNEFYNMGVRVDALKVSFDDKNNYKYNVSTNGKNDVWIANGTDKKFRLGNGKTEYNSSMYDDDTLAVWLVAVNEFFGIKD